MGELLEWLKENKVSVKGKYKGKRWGAVKRSENGGWKLRVCVQYGEYLEPVLSGETAAMQQLAGRRTGHEGCGRRIGGKCAFTGFDLANPAREQLGLAKRLITFRLDAIRDGRAPECSYIKLSEQGKAFGPCTVCKVCDPKCRAMKKC